MRKFLLTLSFLSLLLLVVSLVLAAGGFSLTTWSVDSGGGQMAGGDYVLQSAIGQPDAGTLSGGDFTLSSGLLQPAGAPQYWLFLPLVRR